MESDRMIRRSSWQIQVWDTPFGGWRKVLVVETVVAQSLRHVWLFQPHGPQYTRSPGPPSSPKAYSNSYPSSQWCHPTISFLFHSLLLLPSIFSSIRVFSNESTLSIRWPKYWSFSFSISPSNVYSGLISFRIDRFGSPCSPMDSQESSPTP